MTVNIGMRYYKVLVLLLFLSQHVCGQEFFINAEAANTLPKGAIMPHLASSIYNEIGVTRIMAFAGLNVGITSKFTARLAITGSNHHGESLPENIVSHNHGGTNLSVLRYSPGIRYDFKINGLHLLGKYRLLSIDKKKKHFRVSLYAEYSTAKSPHDESEPNLIDDNSGYGGGIIVSKLINRFAISSTVGLVVPKQYEETGDPVIPDRVIDYGRAVNYSLSLGYLLYPKAYTSYDQTNYNVYLEFVGHSFEAIDFQEAGQKIELLEPAHSDGAYLEIYPGIQRIKNSNTILEFSAGFRFFGRSYAHANPLFKITWRKILYAF